MGIRSISLRCSPALVQGRDSPTELAFKIVGTTADPGCAQKDPDTSIRVVNCCRDRENECGGAQGLGSSLAQGATSWLLPSRWWDENICCI